ncbi:hypothetical protein ACVB55_004106, partial [Escherichia coli]
KVRSKVAPSHKSHKEKQSPRRKKLRAFLFQRWTLSGHMKIKNLYFQYFNPTLKPPAGAF